MRNIVAHVDFGVDPEEVWSAVEIDLPALKMQIRQYSNIIAALRLSRLASPRKEGHEASLRSTSRCSVSQAHRRYDP